MLVRHHYCIDHVNHTVGLKYIGDRDHRCAALFVLEFDTLPIVESDPELAALDGRQFCRAFAFFDLFHQVMSGQTARHNVIGQNLR